MLALFVDGASRLGLYVLARARHIEYRPIALALSERERREATAIVAAKEFDCLEYDAELGWAPRPGACANSLGARGRREYSPRPAPGIVRLAAFGDSFTWGHDCTPDQTWEHRLEVARPNLEVLNYGVGAYGVDQALLRFERAGADAHASIVLIGFISENVIRHVNVYRPFIYPGAFPLTKPRFVLAGDGLALLPNPIPTIAGYQALLSDERASILRFGEHDAHFRSGYHAGAMDWLAAVRFFKLLGHTLRPALDREPIAISDVYDTRLESFRVTTRLFDRFSNEVAERGSTPVIVILPTEADLGRRRAGQPPLYGPLLEHFRARGYRVIDTSEAFNAAGDYFTASHHLNAAANQLVGDAIGAALERDGLIPAR